MKANNKGFIKLIILIVVILIVLGWYGFSVQEVVESEGVQSNWYYVKSFFVGIWNNYLVEPATWVWEHIFVQGVFEPFKGMLDNGIPTIGPELPE